MRIKSKDIAEKLGVSTATVSLALNNKPGVNPETRKKILEYYEYEQMNQLEKVDNGSNSNTMIRVILYVKTGVIINDPNNRTLQHVLGDIERISRNQNMDVNVIYYEPEHDKIDDLINQCKKDRVEGVILFAGEMDEEDFKPFMFLEVPLLVYDNDFTMFNFDSIVSDNQMAIDLGVTYLKSHGINEIVYFRRSNTCYNFEVRRKSFYNALHQYFGFTEAKIIEVGEEIDEIYKNIFAYLSENKLPQSIFCENYSVSVGVVAACKDLGIKIPEDLSIIGIDEVPRYLMSDLKMTWLNVVYDNRGYIAINRLIELIDGVRYGTALKISLAAQLIPGNSVRNSL